LLRKCRSETTFKIGTDYKSAPAGVTNVTPNAARYKLRLSERDKDEKARATLEDAELLQQLKEIEKMSNDDKKRY